MQFMIRSIKSLTKDERKRPKYKELLKMPLVVSHTGSLVNVAEYFEPRISQMN